MKGQYVSDLREGERVDDTFAMTARELRSTRTGEAYLSMEFADRTGRMPGVRFRPGTAECDIPAGVVVRVRGTVTTYRGVQRVSVDSLRPAETFDREDMLPSGSVDRAESEKRFRQLVGSVGHPGLRAVVRRVFASRGFFGRFAACPGSQTHHHAYVGGLLEHTVAVATICSSAAERYPEVHADLLLAAALLHDIGKVDELSFETSIEYSDEGRLLGHVVLGERRLRAAINDVGEVLDSNLALRLSHAMVSHHGELEWGAPKRPSTLEALILHHADNLDAKAAGFMALTNGAQLLAEQWTDASNLFRRPLFAPRAAEDDRWMQAREDDQWMLKGA